MKVGEGWCESVKVWSRFGLGMVKFGTRLVKFGIGLLRFGRVWRSLVGFGKIW